MQVVDIISENVHNPTINWEKFGIALAAYSAVLGPDGSPDFKGVDAIILLGLAGDPNSQSVLGVRYKSPVKIGVTNDQGNAELGWNTTAAPGLVHDGVAGQYWTTPVWANKYQPNKHIEQYTAEYQIILNYRRFDVARVNRGEEGGSTELLAHEAAHRGFDILKQIPAIYNKLSPKTKYYMDYLMTGGDEIPGFGLENTGKRDFLEHLMIYSVLNPDFIAPDSVFRSKQEVRRFQKMYEEFENAAGQYLSTYQVSAKELASLQKEVNKYAPSGIKIQIKPAIDGTLQVIGVNVQALKKWLKQTADQMTKSIDINQLKKQANNTLADVEALRKQAQQSIAIRIQELKKQTNDVLKQFGVQI